VSGNPFYGSGLYEATQQKLNKDKQGWTRPEYVNFSGQVVADG